MLVRPLIQLARPGHWIKNVVVILSIVFGQKFGEMQAWLQIAIATAAFCFASSFAYILNDIKDRQSDQAHPLKSKRPLASGQISTKTAVIEALVFLILALVLAQGLSLTLVFIILAYLLLQVFYTLFLKMVVLVDVICISLGFVLRAVAGAVAIRVVISPWLFICMFTLWLFMGFCKRYSEAVMINDSKRAHSHRAVLIEYTPELLTHLITLSAGIAVISFLLYGLHQRTVEQFGTNYFIYTLPIVVYAVFRFAMLSMKGSYAGPTDLIIHDVPFQLTILIWIAIVLAIIRWGKDIESWIQGIY